MHHDPMKDVNWIGSAYDHATAMTTARELLDRDLRDHFAGLAMQGMIFADVDRGLARQFIFARNRCVLPGKSGPGKLSGMFDDID